ncbi:MAG: hypothetical protein F6K11_30475 [Leptolyngbya sp. SIO3F4]|nr:hypothetical protein [Leptolyngbya sp. SIO3F4]
MNDKELYLSLNARKSALDEPHRAIEEFKKMQDSGMLRIARASKIKYLFHDGKILIMCHNERLAWTVGKRLNGVKEGIAEVWVRFKED